MDTAIIFVALIGLMYAAYKGASIIWVAPLFAVLAALGSEHAPLPIFSELYMTRIIMQSSSLVLSLPVLWKRAVWRHLLQIRLSVY